MVHPVLTTEDTEESTRVSCGDVAERRIPKRAIGYPDRAKKIHVFLRKRYGARIRLHPLSLAINLVSAFRARHIGEACQQQP